ncbi:MAG: hypothetical protein ACFCAD_08450, partial [Pleurocapsa sp.]
LENQETYREWSFNQSWFRWVFRFGLTVFFIVYGLYMIAAGITDNTVPDSTLAIVIGIVSILLSGLFYLIFSYKFLLRFYNKNIEKQWKKENKQEEGRRIATSTQGFTFATEFTELSWTWKSLKAYFEGEKGFLLWFFNLDSPLYIPNRVFIGTEEIIELKNLLKQYGIDRSNNK